MQYYDEHGNIHTYDTAGKLFKMSSSSFLSRIDDLVLKEYRLPSTSIFPLEYEVYKILSEIDHDNLLKLQDVLYAKDYLTENASEEDFVSFLHQKDISAYTYSYVEKEKVNPFIMPKDYFLTNFAGLEELFDIFDEYRLVLADISPKNTILNGEHIVIIDPDYFSLYHQNNGMLKWEEISRHNRLLLLHLMRRLAHNPNLFPKVPIKELLPDELLDAPSMTDIVSKKLRGYSSIKDYFRR